MDWLKQINWHSDDGVFFPMLMDWARNQYYDRLIQHTVYGRPCVDVGFGTGLLTMLAFKHGADHVVAYENNHNRYQLGCHIIGELGLKDRVTLIHDRFSWQTPVPDQAVIISETVGTQLWSEGLWYTMSRGQPQTWLPGSVFMEVIAEPVAEQFAMDLFRPAEHFGFFNPAVDIDPSWVGLINQLVGKTEPNRSNEFWSDNHQSTVWGGWTFAQWARINQQPRAGYSVDLGHHWIETWDQTQRQQRPIDFSVDQISFTVPLPATDLPILVVPRVGFSHQTASGTQQLYLDQAASWGAGCNPMIVTGSPRYVTIKHSVSSGIITYSPEN